MGLIYLFLILKMPAPPPHFPPPCPPPPSPLVTQHDTQQQLSNWEASCHAVVLGLCRISADTLLTDPWRWKLASYDFNNLCGNSAFPSIKVTNFHKIANKLPYHHHSVAAALAFCKSGILCGHGEFWTSCFVTCIVMAGHLAEGRGLLSGSVRHLQVCRCSHFTSPRLRFVLYRDFFVSLVFQC